MNEPNHNYLDSDAQNIAKVEETVDELAEITDY